MRKIFLIYGLLLSSCYCRAPMDTINDLNDLSNNILKKWRAANTDEAKKNPDFRDININIASMNADRAINIASGRMTGISEKNHATVEDRNTILGVLYQAAQMGKEFVPKKYVKEHVQKHTMVLDIMQKGIQAIVKDFTLGANREDFLYWIIDHKSTFLNSPYGIQVEKFLTINILKKIFPKDFFLNLNRLGIFKQNRKEELDFAMAVHGVNYTIDKNHFLYDQNQGSVQVTYTTEQNKAVFVTTKTMSNDPKAKKTFRYKKYDPNLLYDQTFLDESDVMYKQIPGLSREDVIAKLFSTFNKNDRIDSPCKILYNTVYLLNFKHNDSSTKTTLNYLQALSSEAIDFKILKEKLLEIEKISSNKQLKLSDDFFEFSRQVSLYIESTGNQFYTYNEKKTSSDFFINIDRADEKFQLLLDDINNLQAQYDDLIKTNPLRSFEQWGFSVAKISYPLGDMYTCIDRSGNNIDLKECAESIRNSVRRQYHTDTIVQRKLKEAKLLTGYFSEDKINMLRSAYKKYLDTVFQQAADLENSTLVKKDPKEPSNTNTYRGFGNFGGFGGSGSFADFQEFCRRARNF